MNVIITTLANQRYNAHGAEEQTNRACTAEALRRWAGSGDLQPRTEQTD